MLLSNQKMTDKKQILLTVCILAALTLSMSVISAYQYNHEDNPYQNSVDANQVVQLDDYDYSDTDGYSSEDSDTDEESITSEEQLYPYFSTVSYENSVSQQTQLSYFKQGKTYTDHFSEICNHCEPYRSLKKCTVNCCCD